MHGCYKDVPPELKHAGHARLPSRPDCTRWCTVCGLVGRSVVTTMVCTRTTCTVPECCVAEHALCMRRSGPRVARASATSGSAAWVRVGGAGCSRLFSESSGVCEWKMQGGQLVRVGLVEREPLATLRAAACLTRSCHACFSVEAIGTEAVTRVHATRVPPHRRGAQIAKSVVSSRLGIGGRKQGSTTPCGVQ